MALCFLTVECKIDLDEIGIKSPPVRFYNDSMLESKNWESIKREGNSKCNHIVVLIR